MVRDAHIMKV